MSLEHIPFFYIIEHKPTGKLYAGAKWSNKDKKCNPDSFMRKDGYTTSSKIINEIINKEGLLAFRIVLILTEKDCNMNVYDYETIFLQSNEISSKENWFNKHENVFDQVSFYKTERCSKIWSEARKKYLETEENMKLLVENCRKLANNQEIQAIKSIKMSGHNNPMYGKTHSEEKWNEIKKSLKGRQAWNEGKTKETDERVKKQSVFARENNGMAIKLKITLKTGEIKTFYSINQILKTFMLGGRYRAILKPGIFNPSPPRGKSFSRSENDFNELFENALIEFY